MNKDQKEGKVSYRWKTNKTRVQIFFPNYMSPVAQSHDDSISHNLISLILPRNKSFPYLI